MTINQTGTGSGYNIGEDLEWIRSTRELILKGSIFHDTKKKFMIRHS